MTADLEVLTLAEVAAMLRTPAGTLRYWRSVDRGPKSFRTGSTVKYLRADVDEWVASQVEATARGGVAS